MTRKTSIARPGFAVPATTLGLVMLLVFVFVAGCDLPDPTVLLPQSTQTAEGTPEAGERAVARDTKRDAAAVAKKRAPGMESIGPEDSQRIYYQFIDDRGRVQFVERLAEVPVAWRDRVGYVEMSQPPPLTPVEARKSWQLSDGETARILLASSGPSPAARRGNRQVADVVLYSADWCGYCKKAQAHLDREDVDYEIRDVDIQANAQELREKTGRGGIPVLDYSGQILRGYRAEQYDQAIESIQG